MDGREHGVESTEVLSLAANPAEAVPSRVRRLV
ncbi:MAG: hypothetical protein RLZZ393_2224 [Pseudomonadota bacterium]|jgi:hypothetical protein